MADSSVKLLEQKVTERLFTRPLLIWFEASGGYSWDSESEAAKRMRCQTLVWKLHGSQVSAEAHQQERSSRTEIATILALFNSTEHLQAYTWLRKGDALYPRKHSRLLLLPARQAI